MSVIDAKEFRNLVNSDDMLSLNAVALDCSKLGAQAAFDAATMELQQKGLRLQLRDGLMQQGMLKGAADDQATQLPEYVEFVREIAKLNQQAEEFRAFARYFNNRIQILLSQQGANNVG